jgi:hypothetical protein
VVATLASTVAALITAHCNNSGEFWDINPDTALTTQEKAQAILEIIHGLAATAAHHCFYLRRWTKVVNVMIYKKAGCIELDKLRVIHLFEADFNLMIAILFGRRAMYHQVDRNSVAPAGNAPTPPSRR